MKDALIATRALILDPDHWCQGVLARDQSGFEVDHTSPDACQWCPDGALYRVTAPNFRLARDVERLLDQVATEHYGTGFIIVNDRIGHEAVIRVFDIAIEEAE